MQLLAQIKRVPGRPAPTLHHLDPQRHPAALVIQILEPLPSGLPAGSKRPGNGGPRTPLKAHPQHGPFQGEVERQPNALNCGNISLS
jgi:hypothetical protein